MRAVGGPVTCPASEASEAAYTAIVARLSGDPDRVEMATVLVATYDDPLGIGVALLVHATRIARSLASALGMEPAALAEALRRAGAPAPSE